MGPSIHKWRLMGSATGSDANEYPVELGGRYVGGEAQGLLEVGEPLVAPLGPLGGRGELALGEARLEGAGEREARRGTELLVVEREGAERRQILGGQGDEQGRALEQHVGHERGDDGGEGDPLGRGAAAGERLVGEQARVDAEALADGDALLAGGLEGAGGL